MPAIVELDGVSRANAYLIPVEKLEPGDNSRRWADTEVKELALSIRDLGQLVPVLIRWEGEPGAEKLVIVEGHRRVAAIRYLNEKVLASDAALKVRCEVYKGSEAFAASVAGNLKRKGLTPIDLAYDIQTLEAQGKSRQEIAKLLEIGESRISLALKLLKLPLKDQRRVHYGQLAASAAYELVDLYEAEKRGTEQAKSQAEPESSPAESAMAEDSDESSQAQSESSQAQPAQETFGTGVEPEPEPARPSSAERSERKTTRTAVRKLKRERAERGEQVRGPTSRTRTEVYRELAEYANCQDGTVEPEIMKVFQSILKYMDGETGSRAVLNRLRELMEHA